MNIRRAFFYGILLIGCLAFAEDNGGSKEESGAAPEKNNAEVKEAPVLAPWLEVENKIQTLQTKIQVKEDNLKGLFQEKNGLGKNSPRLKAVVKEIVDNHKELRQLVEDYEKQVTILKYRFPERNTTKERKYDRIDVAPIEDLEKSLGIEGKMDRSLKKMRSQFPNKNQTGETISATSTVKKKDKDREKSIEDAPSIIISK